MANRLPVVTRLSASITTDTPFFSEDLLTGASDPDRDRLNIVNLPTKLVATSGRALYVGLDYVFIGSTLVLTSHGLAAFDNLSAGQSDHLIVNFGVSDGRGVTANSFDLTIQGANRPPVTHDVTQSLTRGQSYVFKVSDFPFSDPGDSLARVEIERLPRDGALLLNGRAVHAGQYINVADIAAGRLVFVSDAWDFSRSESFLFEVQDSHGADSKASTFTFQLTPRDHRPTSQNSQINLAGQTRYTFQLSDFPFSDVDPGDHLTQIEIESLPNTGRLLLNGVAVRAEQHIAVADIAAGKLVYVASSAASGSAIAHFRFEVTDASGRDSFAHTLTINSTGGVNQPPTITVTNPSAVNESAPGVAASVTVTIANQVTISDPDQADVKHPYAGGLAFASATGPAPNGASIASLFTLDTLNGTIAYDRQAFSYLAQGESVTARFSFNASSGPDTLPETITLTINGLNEAPAITVTNPSAVNESAPGVAAPVTVTIANQVTISDPDQADVKHPYAGGLAFASTTGPAPNGASIASLFTLDTLNGTIAYDRQAFSYLAQGESVTARFSFNASSGPDTLPETIALTINGVNEAPILVRQTGNQQLALNTPFSLSNLGADFTDPDQSDSLVLSASANGGALPGWLHFDASSGSLTGTPGASDAGTTAITVTATDPHGLSASETFNLSVTPPQAQFSLSANDSDGTPNHTDAAIVSLTGITGANEQVLLFRVGDATPIGATISDTRGAFRFDGVRLDAPQGQVASDNPFFIRSVDQVSGLTSDSATVDIVRDPPPAGAAGNAATDWNKIALDTIRLGSSAPTYASRALAIESLAVYNALAAIDGSAGFQFNLASTPNASANAAIAQAAHDVLVNLYPNQQARLDQALSDSLAAIPDGSAKTAGISLGATSAATAIALRQNDGYNVNIVDTGENVDGIWRPTAPNYGPAVDPQWANLETFTLNSQDQFLPPAPPEVGSAEWLADVEKTLSLGRADSSTRTADETTIARFWADGTGTYTPPGEWNSIADLISSDQNLSASASAKLLLELNLAEADSAIAAWNTKYTYNAWRPITVAQDGYVDASGNVVIAADPSWYSLLPTPPFPEYVSGHSTFSAAAATILTDFFGSDITFTISSSSIPNVTFTFQGASTNGTGDSSFWLAAQQAGESRILGGVHFEFSDQAGLALGTNVGQWVLSVFDPTADTLAPKVTISTPQNLVSTAPVIDGFVTDNLTGVATLGTILDSGALNPIAFGIDGSFHIDPASLLPAGTTLSAGIHHLTLVAKDGAGNSDGTTQFDFTVAGPLHITLAAQSLQDQDIVTGDSLLAGSVSGSDGDRLTSLGYRIDGGAFHPIVFDGGNSFSTGLDLSKIGTGDHVITLTATDAAGQSVTDTLNVHLNDLPPLTIKTLLPVESADIGVTFRPRVEFSRQVDISTLNSDSFYATDSTGARVAANVIPFGDGTGAWLLFQQTLPGSSAITLHVDGDKIKGLDGSSVQFTGQSTAGGVFTDTFTTVGRAGVPGTILTGIVADTGPDLLPLTPDDIKAGPNGTTDFAHNTYKLPIAGVKVFILGHEDEAVYTDANGRFTLTNVPSGDVKVAVDGNTAINAPAGFYFPELTFDVNVRPGVVNTIAGGQGIIEVQRAHAGDEGVFLPRLSSDILTPLNPNGPTTVVATAAAGSSLTADQVSRLTIEIAPGSLIDAQGNPVANPQVGISAVPPQLILEELPPGVLQHAFDITIQAPGGAVFTTPATLTLPNIQNLAPGTKTYVLSFDHTTGRLVIDGTATVSADGLTVTTDPGSGIQQPGWHAIIDGTEGDGELARLCARITGQTAQSVKADNDIISQIADDSNLNNLSTANSTLGAVGIETGLGGKALDARSLFNDGRTLANDLIEYRNIANTSNDFAGYAINTLKIAGDLSRTVLDGIGFLAGKIPGVGTVEGKIANGLSVLIGAADAVGENLANDPVDQFRPKRDDLVARYNSAKETPTWKKPTTPKFPAALQHYDQVAQTFETGLQQLGEVASELKTGAEGLLPIAQNFDQNQPFGGHSQDEFNNALPNFDQFVGVTQNLPEIPDLQQILDDFLQAIIELEEAFTEDTGMQVSHETIHVNNNTTTTTTSTIDNPPEEEEIGPVLYAAIKNLSDKSIQRTQFNTEAGLQYFFAANTYYRVTVYDPVTRDIGDVVFKTAPSGQATHIPTPLLLPDDSAVYGNGLTLFASYVVGALADIPGDNTAPPTRKDNLLPGTGITDDQALREGLAGARAADSLALPTLTGVIAAAALQGEARAIVLGAGATNATGLTAYVATGTYGLAIVDVSNPSRPLVIAQINLRQVTGDPNAVATDIAYDAALHLVAVADGSAGVVLIDISDRNNPAVTHILPAHGGLVRIVDDVVYATDGAQIYAFDAANGSLRGSANVPFSVNFIGLAADKDHLYAIGSRNDLQIFSIVDGIPQYLSTSFLSASLNNPTPFLPGDRLVAADGKLWISVGQGVTSGGYIEIDVSDPLHPHIVQTANTGIAGVGLALNGTGLAVSAQQFGVAGVGLTNFIDVTNTADESLRARFTLPAQPFDIAIGNGTAFVADGTAGLEVVRYQALDTAGIAPTVSVLSTPQDDDLTTTGLQLIEGTRARFKISVNDDVQVARVELLLNGQVIATNVSYPWSDLSAILPAFDSVASASLALQVRAIDTGGNATLSPVVNATLIRDPAVFALVDSNVGDGSVLSPAQPTVTLLFSKPIDPNTVTAANFKLVAPAGAATPNLVSFTLLDGGKRVQLTYDAFAVATGYSFDLAAASIKDLSGYSLAATDIISHFDVSAAKIWLGGLNGNWGNGINWSGGTVPVASDNVVIDLLSSATATFSEQSATVASLTVSGGGSFNTDFATNQSGQQFTSRLNVTGSTANSAIIHLTDATLTLAGSLDNSGHLLIDGGDGGGVELDFTGASSTITGGGTITLTNSGDPITVYNSQDRLRLSTNSTVENVDNTITGTGQIGVDFPSITSLPALGQGNTLINDAQGTIHADGQEYLVIRSANLINHGLVEATNGANVDLSFHDFLFSPGAFGTAVRGAVGVLIDNTDGIILADGAGSGVNFVDAYVKGGTIKTTNGGTAAFLKGFILDPRATGPAVLDGTGAAVSLLGADAATLGHAIVFDETQLKGSIVNHDQIELFNSGNAVDSNGNLILTREGVFSLIGDTILSGGGEIKLERDAHALSADLDVGITGDEPGTERTLTNVDNLIHGRGTIGTTANFHVAFGAPADRLHIVNEAAGVIAADSELQTGEDNFGGFTTAATLNITNVDLTNRGLIHATAGPGLSISNSTIDNNGGRILADGGGNGSVNFDHSSITGGLIGVDNANFFLSISESTVQLATIEANNGGIVSIFGADTDLSSDTIQGNGGLISIAQGSTVHFTSDANFATNVAIQLTDHSTVELADNYAGTVTFFRASDGGAFDGFNEKVQLRNEQSVDETFADFQDTDSIDLRIVDFASATVSYTGGEQDGILSVSDNFGHDFQLHLTFSQTTGLTGNPERFTLSENGHGGLLITSNVVLGTPPGDGGNGGGGGGGGGTPGTITNTGFLQIGATFPQTDIILDQDTVLTGGGELFLQDGSIVESQEIQDSGNVVTFTNHDNKILSAPGFSGAIGNGSLELVNEADGVINSNGGDLTINVNNSWNDGLILANGGSVTANDIDNDFGTGSVSAQNGGKLTVGYLHGIGNYSIFGNDSTIEAGIIQDGTTSFFEDNGHLIIDQSADPVPGFHNGQISGFYATDTVDLKDISALTPPTLGYSGDASQGTLTISDGAHTAILTLLGNYLAQAGADSAAHFTAANDGQGGTLITTDLLRPNGSV